MAVREATLHPSPQHSEGTQLTRGKISSDLLEIKKTGTQIVQLIKLVFTGGQSIEAKKAALLHQRQDEGHSPQVASFKKWSGGVISRDQFLAQPFSDYQAQQKQPLNPSFGQPINSFVRKPTDQIQTGFISTDPASPSAVSSESQTTAPALPISESAQATTTIPEAATVSTQTSWLGQQLHHFQDRLTQAQNWATRLNQRFDQTALGQAAIQAFGNREEKLQARMQRAQMKLIQRLQASTQTPTGIEAAKNMVLDVRATFESVGLEISKLTSFLSAFNQTVTGFMLKDVIYHYGFEWWLGKLIKAGWTTSLDQIIGTEKAGKATGISLQELAGRLEECFLKDENGFGIRTGSITPERVREAMAGGLDYALKMNLLPTFLGRLPSIKALGVNPGELRQLFTSVKMAFGGVESIKKLMANLKQAKTDSEKAALVGTSLLSGLGYAVLSKLSPTIAEGEMGGANLMIMLNTLVSNFVGETGKFILETQRSPEATGKAIEGRAMKWLHTIQAGISVYNASQSAVSIGRMVEDYRATGSVNPLANIETEADLVKLAAEHPEYFLGRGGGVFGKVLQAENQVIGAIAQLPSQLAKTVTRLTTSAQELTEPASGSVQTPALLYQLNTPKAVIHVFHTPTDDNPEAISVIRVASNGEVSKLESGGSFVVTTKAEPTSKNWLKKSLDSLFARNQEAVSTQPTAQESDQIQTENEPQAQPAVHDYYFNSQDGRQVMIRIDLVAGETLEGKFARLLAGQVDDDISALDATDPDDNLGETVRSLSSDELSRHAGDDRVLEGQIYRDFIQPLRVEAQALGISDDVLQARLVALFADQTVNGPHSQMCVGEFNRADLMLYLLQEEPDQTQTGDAALLPPTLTIFNESTRQVYHDGVGVRLILEPGQGLMAGLRTSLPDETVTNLYRSLIANQLELLMITAQGVTPVKDINLILPETELIIRAISDEGQTVIDEVPSLQSASELLVTPLEQSRVELPSATRPATFLELLNHLPSTKTPDSADTSPPTAGPVEPDSPSVPLSFDRIVSPYPNTGPPIEINPTQPSTSTKTPELIYPNPTLYNNNGDSVTMMGYVQAGDTLSGIVARFLSDSNSELGTWDILRATSDDVQLAVVDQYGNPIRFLNALSPNPEASLIRPGERIGLIQTTEDQVQFEFGAPLPSPPPLTENLVPRANDPASSLKEQQLLALLQQNDSRLAALDLSEATTYTDPDNPDQIVIINKDQETEYRFDPVTMAVVELQRNPVTRKVEVISSQAGILTQFEVEMPDTLVTNLAAIPITDLEARRNAIALAVQRGQLPIPDNFKTLYNTLSTQLPEDQQSKVSLLQAWRDTIECSYQPLSSATSAPIASAAPDSPDTTSTSTSVDLFDMLQGIGLDPVSQLATTGRLRLQRVPINSVKDLSTTTIAESLGVNSSQVVIVPDGPGFVRISIAPSPEDFFENSIVEANRTPLVYTIENPDGTQSLTLQPKQADIDGNKVVRITPAEINPEEVVIRPGLTVSVLEVAGRKIISSDPSAKSQEVAVREQDLTCVVLTPDPDTGTITTQVVENFTLPISTLTQGSVEELSQERALIEATQLINTMGDRKAQVSDDHRLMVIDQEGQPTRVLTAVLDSDETLTVTSAGQPIYFDVASKEPIIIDDKGNLIPATDQIMLPLPEFAKQYGLTLATSGSNLFQHEGNLVYVNEDGMLATLGPNGIEVIGSVINETDIRALGRIDIATQPTPPDGISFTDVASLAPSDKAITLTKQFANLDKHNLFISPDGSKFQYEGEIYLPVSNQVLSDGRPLFKRQEDEALFYATTNGFAPINPAVHAVIPESDLEAIGVRPATVKSTTIAFPRIIGAAAPVTPVSPSNSNTLIHVPTGLPVMEEGGTFFIQMADGRQIIENPFASSSTGIIQVQLANQETRPLNLFELARVLNQHVPEQEWWSVWPKVAVEKVASSVDGLLAPVLQRWASDSLAPIDALAQTRVDLSPRQIEAIVASEERNALANRAGFSVFALARAVYDSVVGGEIGAGGGGGTITMQLARQVFFPETIGDVSTFQKLNRKVEEILVATLISAKYAPQEIVEMYATVTNYGNGVQNGIDAGANYLLDVNSHDELSEAETIMLTVVSQQPGLYNLDSVEAAQKWIERAKRFVRQLEDRQEVTEAHARQLELEIEQHLPTTLSSVSRNELREIFEIAHDKRAVMNAFAKLVMTGQASHVNLFRYLERTGAITAEESKQIQGKPTSEATLTAILEPADDQIQPSLLIMPVGRDAIAEAGPQQIDEDINNQPISPLTLDQVLAYSENSPEGNSLREEAAQSFRNHLHDSPDVMRAFGLNPDETYIVDGSVSVEKDGSFSFTVRDSNGRFTALIVAGRSNNDENKWAIITGIGPSAGFHIIDLRNQIESLTTTPISKDDPDSGLVGGKPPIITFHTLGLADVEGGIFSDMPIDIVNQVVHPHGSQYHFAVIFGKDGNPPQIIVLRNPQQAGGGCSEQNKDGTRTGLNDKNIHVLMVYDDRLPLTPEQQTAMEATLGRLVEALDVGNLFKNPEQINTHGNIEATKCAEAMNNLASDDAILQAYQDLYPNKTPPAVLLARAEIATLLNTTPDSISYIELVAVRAKADNPVDLTPIETDEVYEQPQGPQPLRVNVEEVSPTQAPTPRTGVPLPLENNNQEWLPGNVYGSIQDQQSMIPLEEKTAAGKMIVFNQHTGRVEVINRSGHTDPISPEDQQLYSAETANDVLLSPIASAAIALPAHIEDLIDAGATLLISEDGAIYIKMSPVANTDQLETVTNTQTPESISNQVTLIGQLIIPPIGQAIIIEETALASGKLVGESEPEILAAAVLNAESSPALTEGEEILANKPSVTDVANSLVEKVEAAQSRLPSSLLRIQQPSLVSQALKEIGVASRPIELLPTSAGRAVFEEMIRAVIESNSADELIVWLDLADPDIQAVPTEQGESTVFVNQTAATPVRVLDLQEINGETYVVFEIATGIGGRTQTTQSALPINQFHEVTQHGRGPLKALIVGSSAEQSINPELMRTIHDESMLGGTEGNAAQVAFGFNYQWPELRERMAQGDVATTINPSWQTLAERVMAQHIGRSPISVYGRDSVAPSANGTFIIIDTNTQTAELAAMSSVELNLANGSVGPSATNRACTEAISTGSTAKILTLLAALKEGRDQEYVSVQSQYLGVGNWEKIYGTVRMRITEAVIRSNNPAILKWAEIVGIENVFAIAQQGGWVGEQTVPGLTGCSTGRTTSLMNGDDGVLRPPTENEKLLSVIGQGGSGTPTLNEAEFMALMLGLELEFEVIPGQSVILDPSKLSDITPQMLKKVRETLYRATNYTAGGIFNHNNPTNGWRVMGKTGTAETGPDNSSPPHIRFAGLAERVVNGKPTGDVIAFSVVVPYGGGGDQLEAQRIVKEFLAGIENDLPNRNAQAPVTPPKPAEPVEEPENNFRDDRN